jgi:hypothetical protein
MSLADVVSWCLLVAAAYAGLVCGWLAATALGPAAVERCARHYARPARVTLVGLATGLPLLAIGAAVADRGKVHPGLGALGALLLVLLLLPATFGLAGLAWRIGRGLASPADESRPWRATLRGGLVLAATFLLPFAGWFVLLPWGLVSGFGTAVMAWRSRT